MQPTVEVTDAVAVLRIDRPPANAIDLETARALEDALADVERRADVRALVLTGKGRFFSAGVDLKVVPTYDAARQREMVATIDRVLARLYGLPRPAVAAVNGHAIGGGLVVALACDYRVGTAASCQLGLAEARAAVAYPAAAMAVVQAELAAGPARRLVLLPRNIGPDEARSEGVVDELVEPEAVVPRACQIAAQLAATPPDAYARTKRQLRGPTLARLAAILADGTDPLLAGWLTSETAGAAAGILRK